MISGFLITGLMLRELEETGSISFRRFYARRVRRIVPAATAALIFTVIISILIWFPLRATQVALDAFWAFIFAANWHFQIAGNDYFASGLSRSPIMHYWSLSIEEQFYALWPLALLIVSIFTRHSRKTIITAIIAGMLISLARAEWVTSSTSPGGYFDSAARAWELLLGALVAAVGVAGPRVSSSIRASIQMLGLILIIGNALLVTPDWRLPFPWVAPAALGASLIIWAEAPSGARSFLGNRLAQWLGDVSYSLYVWHFPIIIFATVLLGGHWGVKAGAIMVMLIVAAASRRWIEQFFLDGPFLARAARAKNNRPLVFQDIAIAAVVLIALAGIVGIQVRGPTWLHDPARVQKYITTFQPKNGGIVTAIATTDNERINQVRSALTATAWPASMNDYGTWKMALNAEGASCVNSVSAHPLPSPNWCGNPTNANWLLIGDSVAMSWMPTLNIVGTERGKLVAGTGYGGCQLTDGLEYSHPIFGKTFPADCVIAQERMLQEILSISPEILVLTGHPAVIERLGLPILEAEEIWRQHYENVLRRLGKIPLIIVLESSPWTRGNGECVNRIAGPSPCISKLDEWHLAKARAEAAAVAKIPNAVFIPTRDWFCYDGRCPPAINEVLVNADGLHLTLPSALSLSKILGTKIDNAKNMINRKADH